MLLYWQSSQFRGEVDPLDWGGMNAQRNDWGGRSRFGGRDLGAGAVWGRCGGLGAVVGGGRQGIAYRSVYLP
jgi:hypothetical protein